jgi:hypothetical protein
VKSSLAEDHHEDAAGHGQDDQDEFERWRFEPEDEGESENEDENGGFTHGVEGERDISEGGVPQADIQ